jgi:hypothetical protein
MAAILGHDIGFTLWVKCDRCGEQLMAFGEAAERRPELEALVKTQGWLHLGGDGWLCEQCGSSPATGPSQESGKTSRLACSPARVLVQPQPFESEGI